MFSIAVETQLLQGILSDMRLKQAQTNTVVVQQEKWIEWDLNPRPQQCRLIYFTLLARMLPPMTVEAPQAAPS